MITSPSYAPEEVVAMALVQLGRAQPPGPDVADDVPVVTVNQLPPDPPFVVAVTGTGVRVDGRLMQGGKTLVHPHVQIRVRGQDFRQMRDCAVAIETALDELLRLAVIMPDGQIISFHSASQRSGIIPMGEDDQRRPSVVMNYRICINQLAA